MRQPDRRHPEPHVRRRGRGRLTIGQRSARAVIAGSLLLLVVTLALPIWLPGIVRWLVPDRYIMAYAPEPLQRLVFDTDAGQTLPTAAAVPPNPSIVLPPTEILSPSPLPTIAAPGAGAEPTRGGAAPTVTFTPAFSSSDPPSPAPGDWPPTIQLTGFTHTYQGWNNCGPATLTTTLSFWNLRVTQPDVAAFVKPNPEDRNVRPDELAAYVESLGYEAIVRADGDLELLRRILAAGYPVVIEKGFDPEPDRLGWMGHYLVLTGYSDADGVFYTMDSYLGPDRSEGYQSLDRFWEHFNRLYMVVFPPGERAILEDLIGPEMGDTQMYANAITTAQAAVQQNPANAFAWFNIGSSLAALGDYAGAATAFDQARSLGLPWRILWYQFGPYEAYLKVGRYEDVLTLADAILADNEYSEEAYYYKGLVYSQRGQVNAARTQFTLALRNNAHYAAAQDALDSLPDN